jgi:uncharacterized protein (UPF0548 family)
MTNMHKPRDDRRIESRAFTYTALGATMVAEEVWTERPAGLRRSERTMPVSVDWETARSIVLRWEVKTRSGFAVDGARTDVEAVAVGKSSWVTASIAGVRVAEPVRVVDVVDTPLRCGFAYGTLEGHPVSGEEAFILHRRGADGEVMLTIRSLTRAAPSGPWRPAFPALLIAQQFFRRRYVKSLGRT